MLSCKICIMLTIIFLIVIHHTQIQNSIKKSHDFINDGFIFVQSWYYTHCSATMKISMPIREDIQTL